MDALHKRKSFFAMVAIAAFPAAQAAAWVALTRLHGFHPVKILTLTAAACLALCFSVHITFHEAVHQHFFRQPALEFLMDSLMTLWMGLTLNGYRWHHFNHHRYNNLLEDYSCTWQETADGIKPRAWWRYVFGWPAQVWRAKRKMDQEEATGHLPPRLGARMGWERTLILLFIAGLAVLSWRAALAYVICVYFGWALVAVENYAQHPPIEYGVETVVSYYDALYNFFFCKNGYHAEHHRVASIPWFELKPLGSRYVIDKPYLIAAPLRRDQ